MYLYIYYICRNIYVEMCKNYLYANKQQINNRYISTEAFQSFSSARLQ